SHEEMQEKHKDLAKKFGNQPEHVVEAARRQGNQLRPEPTERVLRQAVAYSTEKNFEREAVTDERALLRDALNRSIGHASLGEIKSTFEKQALNGELREVNGNPNLPSRSFTTREMQSYERDTIQTIERLSQALEKGHSEELKECLRAMARFHRY